VKILKGVDSFRRGVCRHTLEYNIKMDVDEIEWENMGCIQVVQGKFHLRAFCNLGNERSSFTKSDHFSFQVRQHFPLHTQQYAAYGYT